MLDHGDKNALGRWPIGQCAIGDGQWDTGTLEMGEQAKGAMYNGTVGWWETGTNRNCPHAALFNFLPYWGMSSYRRVQTSIIIPLASPTPTVLRAGSSRWWIPIGNATK